MKQPDIANAIATVADLEPLQLICTKINTMSRPRFLHVLNHLVGCMEPGEVYLEVGTHQGGSLIAALTGNEAKAISVDDFSQFQEAADESRLQENLLAFGMQDRVTFHNENMASFLLTGLPINTQVGVYYYDAEHSTEQTVLGVTLGMQFVVDGGFIVLDDMLFETVRYALFELMGMYPELKLRLYIEPASLNHPLWWNGIAVLQVER
jgi:hypothetical protein